MRVFKKSGAGSSLFRGFLLLLLLLGVALTGGFGPGDAVAREGDSSGGAVGAEEAKGAGVAAAASGSDKAREVALGVQKIYETITDLVADFEQTYTYKVTGAARKSSGRVFFKVPGMMRWDYQHPEPRYFVSDGRELFVYEPKAAQAVRSEMTDSVLADSVAFLFGRGDILGSFKVALRTPAPSGGNHHLVLTPLKDEGHYRQVVLEVEAGTSHVVASVVEDPAGNLNKIVFKNLKVNVGLPEDGFKNPIPTGVKILDSGSLN